MGTTFGDVLNRLRKESNMTQSEFGEIFGLSPSAVSAYERNVRTPTYKLLIDFADYFDVSLDYLLGRCDERFTAKKYLKNNNFELYQLLFKHNVFLNGKKLTDSDKINIKKILDTARE